MFLFCRLQAVKSLWHCFCIWLRAVGRRFTFGNHSGIVAAVNWGHWRLEVMCEFQSAPLDLQWAPPLLLSTIGCKGFKKTSKVQYRHLQSWVMVPSSGTMISPLLLVKSDLTCGRSHLTVGVVGVNNLRVVLNNFRNSSNSFSPNIFVCSTSDTKNGQWAAMVRHVWMWFSTLQWVRNYSSNTTNTTNTVVGSGPNHCEKYDGLGSLSSILKFLMFLCFND